MASAVLVPAILVVFGGALSGAPIASAHGGTTTPTQLHVLAVSPLPARVWGPPALTFPVAASSGVGASLGADVATGAPGSAASTSAVYGAGSTGFDAGAFTPMTHCSKMPHIMDLKSH